MSALFISHSSRDSPIAAELREWLMERGFRSLFLDFDPELGIPAGRVWEQELYRQLRACQAVVVLCSAHSMASDWCFVEITHARALGKYIFPLRIGPCALRTPLADLQVVEAEVERPRAYDRLLHGLRAAGLDNPTLWDGSRPPYPGLMAFQESDAAVFFGRDAEIRATLDSITRLRRFGGHRLLFCIGASGSGKSSLIRAGVVPRLGQDRDSWLCFAPFRPLNQPIDEMSLALTNGAAGGARGLDWKAVADRLRRAAGEANTTALLGDLLRDLRQAAGRREATVVIIVDQFEEALVQTKEGAVFLRLVRALAEDSHGQAIVVATLRSDFLGALQNHPALQGLSYETLSLGPLTADGLVQVIEGPAQVGGVELAPGLTQMLLADTQADDGLPLLAFALRELWVREGKTGRFTVETYRDELGGLSGSVARVADALLASEPLPAEMEEELRFAFLAMARIGESSQYLRQAVRWDDLPATVHPLLERFVSARLLVASSDNGARLLEVAHEALFRVWARARAWLDGDRENLRLRASLGQAAREWNDRGRAEELLVHRGTRLEAAEALVHDPRSALDPLQRAYLAACVTIRNNNLEAERRLAVAKRRRVGLTIAGLAVALVIVSAFGFWARAESRQARSGLASLHWINAVTERDRDNDDLKAAHHFMEASALSESSADARNAYFAGAQLSGGLRLAAIIEPRESTVFAAFSADGIVTWGEAGTAQAWNAADGQQRQGSLHDGNARKVSASPHGKFVALMLGDDAVEVYDAQSGRRVAGLPRAAKDLPVYDEIESHIALRAADGRVHIWVSTSDSPLATLAARSKGVVLSRDGERVLTWDDLGGVRVWTTRSGEMLAETKMGGEVIGATFRPDGEQALVWAKRGPASLWEFDRPSLVALPIRAADGTDSDSNSTVGAAFLVGGKRILTWNYGGIAVARLWDVERAEEVAQLRHTDAIRSARFNRDGSVILTWSDDGTVRVWRARDGAALNVLKHDDSTRGVVFNLDETRLLTWSDDHTARVWDSQDGRPMSLPLQHRGAVEGAAFSADGRSLVTWDRNSTRIWRVELAPGRQIVSLALPDTLLTAAFGPMAGGVSALAADGTLHQVTPEGDKQILLAAVPDLAGAVFDATSKRVIAWSAHSAVGIWSTENGQALVQPMRHDTSPMGILGVAISADGTRVLSWGDDRTARLWDSASGKLLRLLRHPNAVIGAQVTADNSRILTWADDRAVRLWDSDGQGVLLTLPAQEYGVRGATLTRDKARILTWDADGALRLWSAADGKALSQFSLSSGAAIRGAAFSRDESRVLAWDEDTVGIWDVGGNGLTSNLARWNVHDVRKATFSADETAVLTQSADGGVRFWEGRRGYPLTAPFPINGQALGAASSHDEKRLLAWSASMVRTWDVGVDFQQTGNMAPSSLQARTGTRLDRLGELEVIPVDSWKALPRQALPASIGP